MSYRGRYFQGEYVPLTVICKDANGVPTLPDDAPFMRVYTPNGTLVSASQIPIMDRFGTTATFQQLLQLNASYGAIGPWRVVFTWSIGSFSGIDEDSFEVIGGGSAQGNVIAAYYFRRPDADYIVFQTDSGGGTNNSGLNLAGRNPRIS